MEPEKKKRGCLITLAVAAATLFILLLLSFLLAISITSSSFNKTLADLEREGFRTSPKGLIPVCSDGENAAIPWEKAQQMFSLKTQAAGDAFNKAQQNFSSLTAGEKNALREAFDANEPVLELMREAVSRPCFTFQPDYSMPMSAWKVPNFIGLRKMVRALIETRGRLALEDGNLKEALECCLLGVQTAQSYFKLDSFLISSLVSLATLRTSIDLCQETMSGRPVPQEFAKELIQILDPQPFKDSIVNGLDMERLMLLDTFKFSLSGKTKYLFGSGNLGLRRSISNRLLVTLGRPIILSDATLIQNIMVRNMKEIRRPYWESKTALQETDKEIRNLSKIHVFARVAIPSHITVAKRTADAEARSQVTRLALACKLYANQLGVFPSKLGQLTPTHFKKLPRDPFTGKDFVYRLLPGGGFALYSVGPNQHDDLAQYGVPDLQKMTFSTPKTPHDDILWFEKPAQ